MAQVTKVTFTSKKTDAINVKNDIIVAWLEAIGNDAAQTSANKAPVDTGRLKNSIEKMVVPSEQVVYIGTNVRNEKGHCYAIDQEFGTSRGIVGKHYLEFGCTAHLNEYGRMLETYLKS